MGRAGGRGPGNSCMIFAEITGHKYDGSTSTCLSCAHYPPARKPFPRQMEGCSETGAHCPGVNKAISTTHTGCGNQCHYRTGTYTVNTEEMLCCKCLFSLHLKMKNKGCLRAYTSFIYINGRDLGKGLVYWATCFKKRRNAK